MSNQLSELLVDPAAVLCGAGVSVSAGLPAAAGLHDLVLAYADHPSSAALLDLYPAQRAQAPRLRFEGILEVFQRLIDPGLAVLEPYTRGFVPFASNDRQPVGPMRMHLALSRAATSMPVITTNVDSLIEAAALSNSGDMFPVVADEDGFAAAYQEPKPGLWKIHGTLTKVESGRLNRVAPGDPSGPVVTLPYISRTRESLARQLFLDTTMTTRGLLVVGYSGSDDFDVTVWLRDASSPRQLVWIQFMPGETPRSVSVQEVAGSTRGFDDGLRKLARAWVHRDLQDKLTVIVTSDPTALVCAWQDVTESEPENRSRQALERLPRTAWERSIVSGALLAQLSHYLPAIAAFERAKATASTAFEQATTRTELAKAWLDLGGSRRHFLNAQREADDAPSHGGGGVRLEATLARARVVKLTAESRMSLTADVKGELERLKATYEKSPSPDLRSVAFMASTELALLGRWRGDASGKSDAELMASGPLPPKAMLAHGDALGSWKKAKTVEDLMAAALKLEIAADFRREIGDIGGLCGSLNVQSMFAQRWAWIAFDPKASEGLPAFPGAPAGHSDHDAALLVARAKSEETLTFARRHGIPFHIGQGLLTLCVCLLRQGQASEASDVVNELAGMSDLDERTDLEMRFCIAMTRVAAEADVRKGAALAARIFANVATDARTTLDIKLDVRIAQVWEAAALNRALCSAWASGDALGRPISLAHRAPTLDAEAYRFLELETVVPKSSQDAALRLLDPLGP